MCPSHHPTRREFVGVSGLLASGLAVAGCGTGGRSAGAEPTGKPSAAPGPDEVLRELLEGNKRFMKGEAAGPRRKPEDFARLAEGRTPRAVIVGCADSRVPVELVFDQGVGDLFVVRVAGNASAGPARPSRAASSTPWRNSTCPW